jgi:DNA (cytosine-5)-methyltransferase 1
MSARRIDASGSSGSGSDTTWPTPTAQRQVELAHGAPGEGFQDMLRLAKKVVDGNTNLGEAWPTPTTTDAKSSARHGYMITGQQGTTLLDAIRLWPTPVAEDSEQSRPSIARRAMGVADTLTEATRLWPTPDAAVGNDGESPEAWRARQAAWKREYDSRAAGEVKAGNGAGLPLTIAAKEWATPTTQDSENDGPPSAFARRTLPLNAQATLATPLSPPDPTTPPDGEPTSSDGRVLNPRFVEALMGFPVGWTDCALSETPSSRNRRQQLSAFLLSATASMPSPGSRP